MDDKTADGDEVRLIVIVSITILLLPLALQRNLLSLAHFSFVAIFSIFYVVVLLFA